MPLNLRSRALVAVVAGACLSATAQDARAEAPRACVDAVDRGQALRDKVKLMEARTAFLVCASSSCPAVIQRDCAQWLAELDTRTPTVILTASDSAGRDVVYAGVRVDGVPFADRLDGIAVPIDPGIHTFRVEPPGGTPFEQTVVVREAEKYQKVHLIPSVPSVPSAVPPAAPPAVATPVPTPSPLAPVAAAPTPAPPPDARETSPGASWKTGAIVSSVVSAAALASFTGFGIGGAVDVHHLSSTCSPMCPVSSVDTAKTYLQVADASLIVGVVAASVATWVYFEWRGHSHRGPSVGTSDLAIHF